MSASQSWWQVIQESLQAQNWPLAEGALRRLLETNPDHLEILDLLGYSLLMQGCYLESELLLRRALEKSTKNFWTPHKLGDALRGQQRMDEAVKYYEQALDWGSNSVLTVRNLLQVLDGINVESSLKRLNQLVSEGNIAWEEGAIEAALASSSPELAVLVCKLGSSNEAVRAKAYTQALSELNLTSLQNLLNNMNDQFSLALKQRFAGATNPTIHCMLSSLEEVAQLRIDGYPEKSLAMIEQHLQNGETNDWWLDNKARALVMLNKRSEAIEIWEQLLKSSDPDLVTASSQMLLVQRPYILRPLEDAAQLRIDGYPEKSLAMIEQHLQNGETNDWWLDNKARALVMLNKRSEAIEIWEQLLKSSDPDLVTASSQMLLVQRPYILRPLEDAAQLRIDGYPEKSLVMIEQHLQNGETNDWWLDNKARALVMLGRRIEAIEIWEQLLKSSDPDLVTVSSQMLHLQRSLILKPLMDFCELSNWPTEFLDQGHKGSLPLQDSILLEISKLAIADRNFVGLGLANHAIHQGINSPWLLLAKAEALHALGKTQEASYWFTTLIKANNNDEIIMIIKNKYIDAL